MMRRRPLEPYHPYHIVERDTERLGQLVKPHNGDVAVTRFELRDVAGGQSGELREAPLAQPVEKALRSDALSQLFEKHLGPHMGIILHG